ncbi:MAG TPA: helicase HerA-like domain-containing protein, partial [Candidatus Hodarchaeales archaeon]|nr:helicase HerA-like domain-containing protein [Candidatus Hodarchaeales archaeon]
VKNAILGDILSDTRQLEIHPLVFLRHALILGASGSGKTVLGKVILEEMLLGGNSALVIDPQGDLCSLALENSEQGKQLAKNVPIKIFTPNSSKGIRLAIDLLATPPKEILADPESLAIVLDATATQILDVLGYNLKRLPPEKAFLEAILKEDWTNNKKLDIHSLARRIDETETIRSVNDGVEIEVPALLKKLKQKELSQQLMKLAIGVDGSFFMGGTPIPLEDLATKPPQLNIVNLASVGTDPVKRRLVVSWILRSVYDWLLRNPQQSQNNIRFVLYIDEVADFMPAHPENPPSKKMLMLLMRQARKYGCACIIATQSPATIDYKAIDNVNTIFVGRIPTQQSLDKISTF